MCPILTVNTIDCPINGVQITKKHIITNIKRYNRHENMMKKVVIISLFLFNIISAYSQELAPLIQEIQKLTLVNDSLQKQIINPLRDSLIHMNESHFAEITSLKSLIKTLEDDKIDLMAKIERFDENIADLSRNNVEKDSLQKQIESLTATSESYVLKIKETEEKIADEKRKNRLLTDAANNYIRSQFDDLIQISTILSVQRDIEFFNKIPEVMQILSDLEKYFTAKELLAERFNAARIEKSQTQLNQINQQSALLDKLKEDIEYYKDYNDELKRTIRNLIELDKQKNTGGDREIQKMKFDEIISELANYMYNYYEYGNYPYLSDIVLEIIKRKQANADASIADLLEKLQ